MFGKVLKDRISEESPLNIKKLKEIISKSFKKLTKSISFAGVIDKFLGDEFRELCS